MIVGLGTDIVSIERVKRIFEDSGDSFAKRIMHILNYRAIRRILSQEELLELKETKRKNEFLAKRFAAKEAAAKALGTGIAKGVSFQDFTVCHDAHGKPLLKVTGAALLLAKEQRINRWHISLSDEREHAIATVIAEHHNESGDN